MASPPTNSSSSGKHSKATASTQTASTQTTSKPLLKKLSLRQPKAKILSTQMESVDVSTMVATAAYYLAEQRHFAPGHELEDWVAAEQQIVASSMHQH